MSHAAAYASVALLFVSIVLNSVSLTQIWVGEIREGLTYMGKVGLWKLEYYDWPSMGISAMKEITWDDLCDMPTAPDVVKSKCALIPVLRACLILGAVFAFFAATGNAVGVYTGNTLIDAGAGVVAAFSSVATFATVGLGFAVFNAAVMGGTGGLTCCIAGGLQLFGGFCGCVGTCQEMREMTKLAASLHIGQYKDAEKYIPRSERSAKIREGEAAEAQVICDNLAKRRKAAEEAAAREGSEISGSDSETEEEKKKKKVPVMLQRVLFRKPQEGDDDEIPTKMLEDAFAEIDGDGSGSIELDELVDALKLCGLAVSKVATDTIMKEIDKNASGDVDLREFIEFFRHIEDLNRFSKKSAKRQQFMSFLLNFCFLADIVVVGVMLMMFIRMDEAGNPDNYVILKNVLMACSAFLGLLFLLVILFPILRMAFGPSVNRMQKQYELAQEIKREQRKKDLGAEEDDGGGGPRAGGIGPDDPPPPVNAAMFGRSYRPGKVDSTAWTPAIDWGQQTSPTNKRAETPSNDAVAVRAATKETHGSGSQHGHAGRASSKNHTMARSWRYDPSNYRVAMEHAQMINEAGLGPSGWAPMQMRDVNIPKQTAPAVLPGAPLALTDAAFPQSDNAR